jgi:hypothetical protein
MDCAVVHTWTIPIPGREKAALDYGIEANAYWSKSATEGKCSEPEMFFFSGHNMWMIKGDPDTLWQLHAAEEAQRLLANGQSLPQDWSYEFAMTGDAGTEYLLRYAAVGQELGLV